MSEEVSNIHEYILWLLWTFMSLVPALSKNGVHDEISLTQDIVKKLLRESLFDSAPGLFDVLQAKKSPPSIQFFKGLPSGCKRLWGIYVLVLEKKGCCFKIYIGSGTSSQGVIKRWRQYDRLEYLPSRVKDALDNSFTTTHKGLLCWAPVPNVVAAFSACVLFLALESAFSVAFWAPIPNVVTAFSVRVLFLALESVFSVAFWALKSKTRTRCI
jgi:hypothetical protein